MSDDESATRIGVRFVGQYYKWLNEDVRRAVTFYGPESTLTHLPWGTACGGTDGTTAKGTEAIKEHLEQLKASLDLATIGCEIDTVTCHATAGNAVLCVVCGTMFDEYKYLKFTQNFVLVPTGSGGFYVRNDVMRWFNPVEEGSPIKTPSMPGTPAHHPASAVPPAVADLMPPAPSPLLVGTSSWAAPPTAADSIAEDVRATIEESVHSTASAPTPVTATEQPEETPALAPAPEPAPEPETVAAPAPAPEPEAPPASSGSWAAIAGGPSKAPGQGASRRAPTQVHQPAQQPKKATQAAADDKKDDKPATAASGTDGGRAARAAQPRPFQPRGPANPTVFVSNLPEMPEEQFRQLVKETSAGVQLVRYPANRAKKFVFIEFDTQANAANYIKACAESKIDYDGVNPRADWENSAPDKQRTNFNSGGRGGGRGRGELGGPPSGRAPGRGGRGGAVGDSGRGSRGGRGGRSANQPLS